MSWRHVDKWSLGERFIASFGVQNPLLKKGEPQMAATKSYPNVTDLVRAIGSSLQRAKRAPVDVDVPYDGPKLSYRISATSPQGKWWFSARGRIHARDQGLSMTFVALMLAYQTGLDVGARMAREKHGCWGESDDE